jgi:hypothetical protein
MIEFDSNTGAFVSQKTKNSAHEVLMFSIYTFHRAFAPRHFFFQHYNFKLNIYTNAKHRKNQGVESIDTYL